MLSSLSVNDKVGLSGLLCGVFTRFPQILNAIKLSSRCNKARKLLYREICFIMADLQYTYLYL